MFYRRLRAVEDAEYGGLGLKFVVPHKLCNGRFTIQDANLLAHDLVEHQQGPKHIGGIGDEMIALGATCYTRVQWGYLRRVNPGIYSPAYSIAADIMNMAELYFGNNVPFRKKLIRSRCDDPTGWVDKVIETAREHWSEYVGVDVTSEERDTYLETCRIYMVHGVKLAHRRFGSGLLAHDTFWNIERIGADAVDSLEYVGQEFSIGYDFNDNVTFNEQQPHIQTK